MYTIEASKVQTTHVMNEYTIEAQRLSALRKKCKESLRLIISNLAPDDAGAVGGAFSTYESATNELFLYMSELAYNLGDEIRVVI